MMRELPANGEGHPALFVDLDQPYSGPGRESLRVMVFNALPRASMRRKARQGELESYLDEMAESVGFEADSLMFRGYEPRRAWTLAIRQVIHGQEPD